MEHAHRFVELGHVIEAGLITYPGLPAPEISMHLSRETSRGHYAPGVEFAIQRISLVGNTGTYVDSPFHRYGDGADLAGLPLSSLADLPTAIVRATRSGIRAVDVGTLAGVDVAGRAVLLHTGGDAGWGTPAYAENIDDTASNCRVRHLPGARVRRAELTVTQCQVRCRSSRGSGQSRRRPRYLVTTYVEPLPQCGWPP